MSPRNHFAEYARKEPQDYKAFSDSMWNGFVSITKHVPIVNRFFSFTPEFLVPFKPEEGVEIGQAYGEVYNFSQGIDNIPDQL